MATELGGGKALVVGPLKNTVFCGFLKLIHYFTFCLKRNKKKIKRERERERERKRKQERETYIGRDHEREIDMHTVFNHIFAKPPPLYTCKFLLLAIFHHTNILYIKQIYGLKKTKYISI